MNAEFNKICANIRYLRMHDNLTQKEMAEILGISVSTLHRIERCEPRIRLNATMLCRLCDHFEISADAVLRTNLEEAET